MNKEKQKNIILIFWLLCIANVIVGVFLTDKDPDVWMVGMLILSAMLNQTTTNEDDN